MILKMIFFLLSFCCSSLAYITHNPLSVILFPILKVICSDPPRGIRPTTNTSHVQYSWGSIDTDHGPVGGETMRRSRMTVIYCKMCVWRFFFDVKGRYLQIFKDKYSILAILGFFWKWKLCHACAASNLPIFENWTPKKYLLGRHSGAVFENRTLLDKCWIIFFFYFMAKFFCNKVDKLPLILFLCLKATVIVSYV